MPDEYAANAEEGTATDLPTAISAGAVRTVGITVGTLAALAVLAVVAVFVLTPGEGGGTDATAPPPKETVAQGSSVPTVTPPTTAPPVSTPASPPPTAPAPPSASEPQQPTQATAGAPTTPTGTDATAPKASPARTPRTTPEKTPEKTPETTPSAPREPARPAAPAGPMVRFSGDARSVSLSGGGRRYTLPAGVPAGTYSVIVAFAGGQPEPTGQVTIPGDREVTLVCAAAFGRCSIK